jgi:uncharacterized protein YwqG
MIKMIRETDVKTIERILEDDVCGCEDDYCKEKREFLLRMLNDARSASSKTNRMKETLYNCSKEVTHTTGKRNYATAMLVDVINTIMDIKSATFEEAVEFIQELLPRDFDETVIPDNWKTEFEKHAKTQTIKELEEIIKRKKECAEYWYESCLEKNDIILEMQRAERWKINEDRKAALLRAYDIMSVLEKNSSEGNKHTMTILAMIKEAGETKNDG